MCVTDKRLRILERRYSSVPGGAIMANPQMLAKRRLGSAEPKHGVPPMKVEVLVIVAAIVLSTSSALAGASFPPNTLPCDAFVKRPDGNWASRPDIKPFDIGEAKGVTLSNIIIARGLVVIRGVDVWEILNDKCG
jgi:hypothetical protein